MSADPPIASWSRQVARRTLVRLAAELPDLSEETLHACLRRLTAEQRDRVEAGLAHLTAGLGGDEAQPPPTA